MVLINEIQTCNQNNIAEWLFHTPT